MRECFVRLGFSGRWVVLCLIFFFLFLFLSVGIVPSYLGLCVLSLVSFYVVGQVIRCLLLLFRYLVCFLWYWGRGERVLREQPCHGCVGNYYVVVVAVQGALVSFSLPPQLLPRGHSLARFLPPTLPPLP